MFLKRGPDEKSWQYIQEKPSQYGNLLWKNDKNWKIPPADNSFRFYGSLCKGQLSSKLLVLIPFPQRPPSLKTQLLLHVVHA